MKNKKGALFLALAFLAGIGVYNLCVFTLIDLYTPIFWVSYTFTTIAFLAEILVPVLLMTDSDIRKNAFLGLPLIILSHVYFVSQLTTGLLFILLPSLLRSAVIAQALLFAAYLIISLSAAFAASHAAARGAADKASSALMLELRMKAENLWNDESDPARKAELKKLFEALKYSDPVSSAPGVQELDGQICVAFNLVSGGISRKTASELEPEVSDMLKLIARRNNLCKLSK